MYDLQNLKKKTKVYGQQKKKKMVGGKNVIQSYFHFGLILKSNPFSASQAVNTVHIHQLMPHYVWKRKQCST